MTVRATPSPELLTTSHTFADRHIGPDDEQVARMLDVIGVESVDALAVAAVPAAILDPDGVLAQLPDAASEQEALTELRDLAARNTVTTAMIGLGYHDTITPAVIRRNVLESPAWYTGYTPYQPEISQGRLEALLNFQTMVADLTAMDVSNSSMLDESTAAAEAMTLLRRAGRSRSPRFVVDTDLMPQTAAVLATRAQPLGIDLLSADLAVDGLPEGEFFGVLAQFPGASGRVSDLRGVVTEAHERGALVAVTADLLALTRLTPPGEWGADAVCGTSQRFGVPMGYGGPHAGYLAVRSGMARQLPGRLVGLSVDADGAPAYRLALQTREQHIRREKATSNICTAQVLLAVVAAMYASYHGADGLRAIAGRVHAAAATLAAGLRAGGVEVVHDEFFDTVLARVPQRAGEIHAAARTENVTLRLVDNDHIGISCDEATTPAHLRTVLRAFGVGDELEQATSALPGALLRTTEFLTAEAFTAHRSETAMLRYLRALSDRDMALDRTMIPLGSCTMKLNATAEMEPITWPGFAGLHPFAPITDADGFQQIIADLERWLVEITGYAAVSLQPNAGSQGEYAGLLAIRGYHRKRGEAGRTVCLIPSSAHGTNAASAVMAGMRVVVVACTSTGDVDLGDLADKITTHADELAAIMVTYPSTHGVYEHEIKQLCEMVHDAGGQVYVDGANLNALVGLARPGRFGADVSHLNLHKTFCIPHGGGGPGVGPIGVGEHLREFLPGHPFASGLGTGGPVSGAPWGSASILPISWAYVRMMGASGLRRATLTAVASANYMARRLDEHFPVLYTGDRGMVAHECILDLRQITKATGVTVDDVAKRLADYGFHAPTMSFPVAGTLMIEPTESENLGEIDQFVDAMIAIRREIDAVASGRWPAEDNPLVNAPHTARSLARDWNHPYTREEAVFPGTGVPGLDTRPKVFPAVRRVDGAHGDRNLVCSCPPISAYSS